MEPVPPCLNKRPLSFLQASHDPKHRSEDTSMSNSIVAAVLALAVSAGAAWLAADDTDSAHYQVNVNLVVLTFSVTDAKGNAVHGLRHSDIRIFEDDIPRKVASFSEGSKP